MIAEAIENNIGGMFIETLKSAQDYPHRAAFCALEFACSFAATGKQNQRILLRLPNVLEVLTNLLGKNCRGCTAATHRIAEKSYYLITVLLRAFETNAQKESVLRIFFPTLCKVVSDCNENAHIHVWPEGIHKEYLIDLLNDVCSGDIKSNFHHYLSY